MKAQWRLAIGAAVLMVWVTACGGPAEPVVDDTPAPPPEETQTPTESPVEEVVVTIGDEAKVPEGFPEDVPVYPGLNIETVNQMPVQNATVIMGTTADPVATVASYLKNKMTGQGWTSVSVNETNAAGAATTVMIYSKENRVATFTLVDSDRGTEVSISAAG
jgi:hypothetical protein